MKVGLACFAYPFATFALLRVPFMFWPMRVVVTNRGINTSPIYLYQGGRFGQFQSFRIERPSGAGDGAVLCLLRRDRALLEFTVVPAVSLSRLREVFMEHGVPEEPSVVEVAA